MRLIVVIPLACAALAAGPTERTHTDAKRRDKAIYVERADTFMDKLKELARQRDEKPAEKAPELRMDLAGLDLPGSPGEFKQAWHFPPTSQDLTGACWSFAATSYFESEVYRLTHKKIKFSVMHTVYWEYVEKARRFVRERGDSVFGKGSQPNATTRIGKTYGAVPFDAYTGLKPGQDIHDDRELASELRTYLQSVKQSAEWNEAHVLATVRAMLDHHMGAPPSTVTVDGKTMTPQEFVVYVGLNLDDYVDVMSFTDAPFYRWSEYKVPDNWWHCNEYVNVPIDDLMRTVKRAVRDGHSICWGGDTDEPGFFPEMDVAMVPTFDIPSQFIDDSARQLRFVNGSTTDEHGVHLVGYLETNGQDWYLIKDSMTWARDGHHEGYMFYHEDYVKLKTLSITVHKDVVPDILAKCSRQKAAPE